MSAVSGIFTNIKQLIRVPDTPVLGGAVQPPRVGFSDFSQIPSNPLHAPGYLATDPPPIVQISSNPQSAAYQAAQYVLAFAGLSETVQPEYSTPRHATTLPNPSVTPPPLDYPQQAVQALPASAGLTAPDVPAIEVGTVPEFLDTGLDAYTFAEIAPFDEALPEYITPEMDALADPQALDYTRDAALIERMKATLAGTDMLEHEIRELMLVEATDALDHEELFAARAVMAGSAARGFSLPNGAATAASIEIAHAGRQKRLAASFAVRDEVYQRAQKTLETAMSQAMALEAKHAALFLSYCAKLVETLKFNVRMHATLFGLTVDLYNSKLRTIQTQVGAYREYVRTVIEQDSAFAAEVRAKLAAVATYKARVDVYGAQSDTIRTIADMNAAEVENEVLKIREYQAYLVGVRANVGIVKQNIEAYREAVRAFSRAVESESEKFAAYSAQVDAEGSAAGVYAANVGAYSGFWRAETARTNAYSSYVDQSVSAFNAELGVFKDAADAQRSFIAALTARVGQQASAARSFTQAVGQAAGYSSAWNRASAAVASANNAMNLAKADATTRNEALRAQAEAEQARLDAGFLAAKATTAAGLAQAAYAVRSVSASTSASASAGESASINLSQSNTESGSRSWNYSQNSSLSA